MRQLLLPLYLALALVIGGSSAAGYAANFLLQLIALAIISWSLWKPRGSLPSREAEIPLVFAALAFALVLVQLIPLPRELWGALPANADIARELSAIGARPTWMPLSLDPTATMVGALWMLPAAAVLFAILIARAYRDHWIALSIVLVSVASVLLGAIQIAGGPESLAYLYARTNPGIAVGFFANGNHQATLLLCSLPFIAALYVHHAERGSSKKAVMAGVLCGTAVALVLVGLAINGSLAGIGLAVPVVGASAMILGWRRMPSMRIMAPVLAALAILSAVVVLVGPFGNNLISADAENDSDSRLTVLTTAAPAVVAHAPFGTGLGTFVPIYKRLEDADTVDRFYMNNAHNDYLQVALEAGLPGLILVLLVLAWIAWRTATIWRASQRDPMERAATIALAAIALHSLVDYPLRTAAISCVFAACLALIARPGRVETRRRGGSEPRGVHLEA